MRTSRALFVSLALLATATAGGSAETARADDAQVTVVSAGGEQQALSLAALAGSEDVEGRAYALRSAEGESSQTVTGFSLGAILDAAGADPYGFSYLEVQRPAGGSVLLSRDQALDPGAFADGPPVIYATPAGTGFLRPSGSAEDLNSSDSFEAPQGITIVLRNGAPLQVKAEASTLRTRPGKPVHFEAIVDRAGAGEQLDFSWYFDDGASASGATARHSFAKRGSYDVVVGVTTPGDRAGASAVVTIQVGAPLSGPDRRGGGRNRDADAPDHGAATGTRGAALPGPGAATQSPAPQPHPKAKRRQQPVQPEGERVSGLLLSNTKAAPTQLTDPPAARSGHLAEKSDSTTLPDAALGLVATLGLLSLGALTEARSAFVRPGATNGERGSQR